MCSKDELLVVLHNMYHTISEQEDYLNELDSVIGDAEHGSNLKKALQQALTAVETSTCDSPAEMIVTFGNALTSSGYGSGPLLYGLAIRALGRCLSKFNFFDPAVVAHGLEEALQVVKTKGGAEVGDKTMVDALEPAVQAFREAVQRGGTLVEALFKATEAAEKGMLSTRNLVGKKGRSSYLGERGVGHQDPGATSTYLLLRSAYETLARKEA